MTNTNMGRSTAATKPKGKGCVVGIIVLVLFCLAMGGTLFYISSFRDTTLAETVEITIPEGSSSKEIAKLLADNGVVASAFGFSMYVKQNDQATKLKPGSFTFEPGELSLEDVTNKLVKGGADKNTKNVTIPEGLTVEQTAKKLAAQGVVDEQAFLDYAAKVQVADYIPAGNDYNRLEGFLFPETYNVSLKWTEKEIIDMLLAQFDKTFNEEWRARAKELNMSIYEVVILASIIEREALFESDRPIISGVFHNRLKKPMRLQSCATVQYVLGENKAVLTNADIAVDSPYNTYKNDGLPPGPIASPGKTSIEAALYPEENDYLFFLAMPDGHHYFSKTLDEHNKAKAKYLK